MSADPLFKHYKRARNRLRRYQPESFIGHAIGALHFADAKGIEALSRYQPWNLLLAIKWALQEADTVSHRRPLASIKDLHAVLKILHDIEGEARMPSDYEHVNLFIRHLASEQFSLQRGASGEALARQHLLFARLPTDHPFSRQFVGLASLRLGDYVDLSFVLLTAVLGPVIPRLVRRAYFQAIEATLPPGSVDAFLGTVSKTFPELHEWLNSPPFRYMSIADQKIVPSPLLDVPLISNGSGDYAIISPTLLMRSLESVVYRTLRRRDPEQFGVQFGPIFENYVARCLSDPAVDYRDETWLKRHLHGPGKCVDFMVSEPGGTVLIDAKGIEMSSHGRVSQRAELVLSAIKVSALKAIHQGMATSRRIASADDAWLIDANSRETFLMIVTYDSLFLGSSAEFGAIFGSRVLPKLERDYGASLPIPLDHVFFITIDELERLLALVRSKATTLAGMLRHARSEDANARTRRFHFRQHLEPFNSQYTRLPIIETALNEIIQRCAARLAVM